jgi:hypothetical protein
MIDPFRKEGYAHESNSGSNVEYYAVDSRRVATISMIFSTPNEGCPRSLAVGDRGEMDASARRSLFENTTVLPTSGPTPVSAPAAEAFANRPQNQPKRAQKRTITNNYEQLTPFITLLLRFQPDDAPFFLYP